MKELAVRSVRSFGAIVAPLARTVHFHSLDAVMVAVVWQNVFTIAFLGRFSDPVCSLAVGLIVWLVYTADRLLDACRLDTNQPSTPRHRFHRECFSSLTRGWIVCLVALLVVAIFGIQWSLQRDALIVGGMIALYALQIHCFRWRWSNFSKEAQVALLFGLGITVDTWSPIISGGVRLGFGFGWALVLVAGLFFLNCLHVSFAEHSADQLQKFDSFRGTIDRFHRIKPQTVLRVGSYGLIAVAVMLQTLGLIPRFLFECVMISGLAILIVDQSMDDRKDSQRSGMAMDLAIAIPPCILLLLRILFGSAP